MKVCVFLALFSLLSVCRAADLLDDGAEGVHWALLIAGSKEWGNYRHQSGICHAYHVVRRNGIPEERIVVMMYDDIAYNEENPTPGIIINHPNGSDVYGGVIIDYKGDDITPANFLAILRGDENAVRGIGSGKVIKSGSKDHVFVNFCDHGGPGVLGFPNNDVMTATDFIATITAMHENKKYDKMVLYVEACNSGSIFGNLLPTNISVFVTTSANPDQSSFECHWDTKRKTFINDEYGLRWMEDSDKRDLTDETLEEQYITVRNLTTKSNPQQYGDMDVSQLHVAAFLSDGSGPRPQPIVLPFVPCTASRPHLTSLQILYNQLASAQSSTERRRIRDKIFKLMQLHGEVDQTMKSIVSTATHSEHTTQQIIEGAKHPLRNRKCYEPAVKLFNTMCYRIGENDYARTQLYILVNICEQGINAQTILDAITAVCKH